MILVIRLDEMNNGMPATKQVHPSDYIGQSPQTRKRFQILTGQKSCRLANVRRPSLKLAQTSNRSFSAPYVQPSLQER